MKNITWWNSSLCRRYNNVLSFMNKREYSETPANCLCLLKTGWFLIRTLSNIRVRILYFSFKTKWKRLWLNHRLRHFSHSFCETFFIPCFNIYSVLRTKNCVFSNFGYEALPWIHLIMFKLNDCLMKSINTLMVMIFDTFEIIANGYRILKIKRRAIARLLGTVTYIQIIT